MDTELSLDIQTIYVLIKCDIGYEEDIISELAKIPEVKEVRGTYGIYDIFFKIKAEDKQKLDDITSSKIRKIPHIRSTVTLHPIPMQGGKEE